MQYGMICYAVPHRLFPAGYHCDPSKPLCYGGLASQKNYMSVYLMCIYGDQDHAKWFREAWKKSGKKLDAGKGCIRFKKVDDLPLDVIGEAIRRVPARNTSSGISRPGFALNEIQIENTQEERSTARR